MLSQFAPCCVDFTDVNTPPKIALFLAVVALLCPAFAATSPLQTISNATYVAHTANDGDSFMAKLDRAEPEMLRIYFVDALEKTASADSDKRRLRDQARHFGISDPRKVIAYGEQAGLQTSNLLAQGFTVHTARARAPGRSKKPRIYAMVTLNDGRDLAAILVSSGLARAKGVTRARPDGTTSKEYMTFLADLELAAALGRKGLWAQADPDRLAGLRRSQRDEQRELQQAFGVFGTLTEDHPIDLTAASAEELQQLHGVGAALAGRIIAHRPFTSVDELSDVAGIGPTLLQHARPFVTVSAP